ncbi:hypothetical protein IGB42_01970 [Andreprevotia sp. IGB-42]|uniref:hypothetical protein n=1 Tax=Andreprevotia sp. IGB-42 TaxID=2497473 RepID=UPI00135B5511|nr:hypothetical protein [Andreprevotia sp. IGB-42]KAF0813619.1 hypothetical protein IGB42_01970 [Andreprevotia sp. IGB-42]
MNSLVDRQALIDQEVVNALITATPETWNSAKMVVEREESNGQEKMAISISSPEGHGEIVGPTEEIFSSLYKLSDLFREYGSIWSRAFYSVKLQEGGSWRFSVRFEY